MYLALLAVVAKAKEGKEALLGASPAGEKGWHCSCLLVPSWRGWKPEHGFSIWDSFVLCFGWPRFQAWTSLCRGAGAAPGTWEPPRPAVPCARSSPLLPVGTAGQGQSGCWGGWVGGEKINTENICALPRSAFSWITRCLYKSVVNYCKAAKRGNTDIRRVSPALISC